MKRNCVLIRRLHFSETGEMRGKIDAKLPGEQHPQKGCPPQMAILGPCGDRLTHLDMKEVNLG